MHVTNPKSLTSAQQCLEALGWTGSLLGKKRLTLESGSQPAVLRQLNAPGRWDGFEVLGPGIPRIRSTAILRRNGELPGPLKFVPCNGRSPICRADLPEDVSGDAVDLDVVSGETLSPMMSWAEAVTRVAAGDDAPIEAPLDVAAISDALTEQGWVASPDGGAVHVTLPMTGAFQQVRIQSAGTSGTVARCELVDLSSWSDLSRQAVLALAESANERLMLARYTRIGQSGGQLAVEVHLSRIKVRGAWLRAALEAIRAAAALSFRELVILDDQRLAKHVVANLSATTR